ncbi:MAG: helix-turn-helix domain-containing protein [Gammaproteobacteria bacterium]
MTAQEVASLLRLTRKQLHDLVRQGIGPPHVQATPQRRVFPRSGLAAFIKARHSEASSS